MTREPPRSLPMHLLQVLALGTVLGVLLFVVYIAIAMLE